MELFPVYFQKGHALSKMDARLKLVIALAILGMVLGYKGFFFPLAVSLLCLVFYLWIRVPVKVFTARFVSPLLIALILLLLKFFFSGKHTLFSINAFGLQIIGYKDGLMEGLLIATRVMGAVSIISALCFSTAFTELVRSLSWIRIPKVFIEILIFAYRYIFVFLEETTVIYNAQKNRLGYSSLKRGLRSFGILGGSLTLRAFDYSQNLTISMLQRGYDGTIPVLKYRNFKNSEVFFSALFILAMVILWRV